MAKAKKRLKEHRIHRDWCKGCGICVHFCPKSVLELDAEDKVVAARPEDCICCMLCELRCPDLAIEVAIETDSERDSGEETE
ncbi:MAG: ferredoxin family protein [Desulfococcaceae bacterium]